MSDGSNKQKVLIVDDEPRNQRILSEILSSHADCLFASSGEEALHIMKELTPDLLLLDIMMPGMDGYSVCRQLRSDSRFESTKVILLSGKAMVEERLKGYEHGADDYITKPFVPEELLAKAKVYLRLTRLEKENLNRLSRFFPPHLKEHILSGKIENPFSWRRAEVTVIFIDLRGFTHFTETADPTTVMTLLHEYYHTVAKIAYKYGGSVGHLAGDGIMVFFNDLLKIDRPEEATTRMALESRKAITELSLGWRKKGIELGFGMGLAHGKATIGGIGSEGFWDFSVVGNVTNLASRLCDIAVNGQILISEKFVRKLEGRFKLSSLDAIQLKGMQGEIQIYNVDGEIEED